jgi:hypothetical protein
MLNPFKDTNWRPDATELRSFGKSLVIGFPVLALVFAITSHVTHGATNLPLLLKFAGVGVAAGCLFMAVPPIGRPFYLIWYAVACCMGLVIGNVLLGLLYYVVFTGIGLLMRVFGRLKIRKAIDRQTTTYWKDAEQPAHPKRYYNQY